MATHEQAAAEIDEFIRTSVGLSIDPDGMYGLQCKDLADYYCMILFGLPLFGALEAGDAETAMSGADSDYFHIIWNNENDPGLIPRRGDIIVWNGTEGNPYGHIAVVSYATADLVTVIEQDGGLQVPTQVSTWGYYLPGTGSVLGWLRPKAEQVKYTGADKRGYPKELIMAKQYKHETKWTTKNQVARSFYGHGPKPTGVTFHWWGNRGQKFDDVAHFLSTNNVPTSAHYVVEDGRVATLAVPEMATYHCGHTIGNGSTIGIECRPEMTKGDVDTVVQLVYELEQTYGSLLMYEHKHWFPTACSGTWGGKIPEIIDRVNAMHKNGGRDPKLSTPAPKPAPQPEKPKVTPQSTGSKPVKADPRSPAEVNPTGYDVWAYKNARFEDRDAYAILRGIAADVTDIKSKLEEK